MTYIERKMYHFSIVIPCYNEEAALPKFIEELKLFIKQFSLDFQDHKLSVLIVNNNSSDSTTSLLNKYINELPDHVKIIDCLDQGYGAALKHGFISNQADYYGFCDLDLTYPLSAFLPMYNQILKENSDIVFADRMRSGSQMPLTRRLGNFIYKTLCKLFFKSRLNDVCTGQRVFSKKILPEIINLKTKGLEFSIDFSCLVLAKRWSYSQHVIHYEERLGPSKLSIWKDGVGFLIIIFSYLSYKKKKV